MRLAILTGMYVGVVCAAQIGAQKIVELPWTGEPAPGGAVLIGVSLALVELAHHTAPTRREGWRNAQVMIVTAFAASALLAGWVAVVDRWTPAFPGQGFEVVADTWRIVAGSLAAFALSETLDNGLGAWMRDRVPDAVRVLATNAVSAPLDTFVFLADRVRLARLLRRTAAGEVRSHRPARRAARPRHPPCPRPSRRRSGNVKQIYPNSITGKGAVPGGSVLDHRFGQSDPYTLGVEEEYMLLDGETFDLVQHIDTVLQAISGHELEPRINAELMQSVLEIATPVCHTAADVQRELSKLRSYVTQVGREKGLRVGSSGTHPFSLFERQRITARDRYRNLVDQLQYVARRELIFGMHVHVAVDDPEKAIQVVNGLLPQLGPLLALSASSPFWRGEPTGLSSSRQMVFAAFPRSGPPPRFRDYADYAEVVGQLERTGCIADYTHIWWDIRLHPRLGTVEIRICDAVTRVEDATALAAYCQALVKLLSERFDRGEEIPSYHRILTTENKWLAARYGLEAPVMDLATGRRNRLPVAQIIRRTLREIEPHARELGSDRELEGIVEILSRGNGADRQLRVFNANRDIVEVVEEIAKATEAVPAAAP